MPTAEIEIIDVRKGTVLNDVTALHIRADQDFTDFYGQKRKAGSEWLIDKNIKDVHILDANEILVQEKKIIVLTLNQYCTIRNPVVKDGNLEFGKQ